MTRLSGRDRAVPILLLIGLLALGAAGCAGTREPLLGIDFFHLRDNGMEGRRLSAVLEDVDDIADVWVVGASSFESGTLTPVIRAEWHAVEGRAKGDISRRLDNGVNYVILTLFNKVYSGPSTMKSGGKATARLGLFLDDTPLYQHKISKDYNEKKLIFAAVFKVLALPGDRVRVVSASEEEKRRVTGVVQGVIRDVLHETADEAVVNWPAVGLKLIRKSPEFRQLSDEWKQLQDELNP